MIDLYTAGPRVSILYSLTYLILTTDVVMPILHMRQLMGRNAKSLAKSHRWPVVANPGL